ncbi:MAG: preprotein translocase subunit SecE [Eggerthellaceae bacterium]|nr:preprotein translocase subunit SecE [Eggerthellaceae bacterium]
MAHKSKTQRAKASAAKANKRDREEREALAAETAEEAVEEVVEEPKKSFFKKKEDKPEAKQQSAAAKKEEKKPKKTRFQFFKDVKAEMKRVTWPTRKDVIRWSGVVVGALVLFGVYVAILDNVIVTPALVALSGLGA